MSRTPDDFDRRIDITPGSRVRARRVALGICAQCGVHPLFTKRRCFNCNRVKREAERKAGGRVDRHGTRTIYTRLENSTVFASYPSAEIARQVTARPGTTTKPPSADKVGDDSFRRFFPHPQPTLRRVSR